MQLYNDTNLLFLGKKYLFKQWEVLFPTLLAIYMDSLFQSRINVK